jgi:hypothetical protein
VCCPRHAGVLFWRAEGNTLRDACVRGCRQALEFYGSSRNTLKDSRLTNNSIGIFLHHGSCENTFKNISVRNCSAYGVYLPPPAQGIDACTNNTFCYNEFVANAQNAYAGKGNANNHWDDGLARGNYWDDYSGEDLDGDGIGDMPYEIRDCSEFDFYPVVLRYPFGAAPTQLPPENLTRDALLPDLVLDNASLEVVISTSWQPREGLCSLRVRLRNAGKSAAANAALTVYLDGSIVANATVNKIAANSTVAREFRFAVARGLHELIVVVDEHNNIAELCEDNNRASAMVSVGQPAYCPHCNYLRILFLLLIAFLCITFGFLSVCVLAQRERNARAAFRRKAKRKREKGVWVSPQRALAAPKS